MTTLTYTTAALAAVLVAAIKPIAMITICDLLPAFPLTFLVRSQQGRLQMATA